MEKKKCPCCNGKVQPVADTRYTGRCEKCGTYVVKATGGETRTYKAL